MENKLTLLGYEHKAPEGFKFYGVRPVGTWLEIEFTKTKESNLCPQGIVTHRLIYFVNEHGVRVATALYEI